MKRVPLSLLLACLVGSSGCAAPREAATLRTGDAAEAAHQGEAAIRARLKDWLEANRRRDAAGMRAIWDAGSICWLPEVPELSNAAAARLAGSDPSLRGWSAYELTTERIDVLGDLGVVHNVFTETRHFTDTKRTVSRRLRGSELWQRQANGDWQIIRCVSAPDPWRVDTALGG